MSLIQVKNLSFVYDGSYDYVFEDVSFAFDTLFKTALVGRNARGKTTFLKLLMDEYEYQGEIIKSENCEYFPYMVEDESLLTLDICNSIDENIEQWRLERELHLLKVDSEDVLYRPFQTLSKGEQTKILLAVLFLKNNAFLLIDEPTNHLDQQARVCVAEYLKAQQGFLLVSHDRTFIDMCCDHIIAINQSSIDVVKGNFSSWYYEKQKRDEREIQQNMKLKKDIRKMEISSYQSAKWSDKVEKSKRGAADKGRVGHMAAKMMKRSKNIENRKNKAIEAKKDLLKDIEEYDDLKMFPMEHFQTTLISLQYFSLYYDHKVLFKDLNLSIQNHDRILLKGANGCGKSSLISFIMFENIKYHGEYRKASQLKISYVPQDCSDLEGTLEDIVDLYQGDMTLVKTILRKLGFSRIQFEKKLEQLSEGQKKKIMLAISLSSAAHLYIWDEPLNYIDIFSRIQIEKLIIEYQPTLLFVEHDVSFQEKTATKVIDFNEHV